MMRADESRTASLREGQTLARPLSHFGGPRRASGEGSSLAGKQQDRTCKYRYSRHGNKENSNGFTSAETMNGHDNDYLYPDPIQAERGVQYSPDSRD